MINKRNSPRAGSWCVKWVITTAEDPLEADHVCSMSLREKLVKIDAKIVTHARYVTFQMAEVAVPRDLFREILRLIKRLRAQPTSA